MKDYIQIHDLKDKQKLLLILLKEFHNICDKYGLIYNIFGGTMLGAIRHKGFIPWDDDVDVTMPLNDYYKFINIIRRDYLEDFVIHVYPDINYIYAFAKFGFKNSILYEDIVAAPYNKLSFNIDIFPNYGYPTKESVFKLYNKYEQNIILLTYKIPKDNNFLKDFFITFLKSIKKIRGTSFYINKQILLLSKTKEDGVEYIVCQGGGWGKKGRLEKRKYYDRVLYDFENIKVWGIRDYHQHLTNLYGDYLTLPPADERINTHKTTAFVSKEIYKMYLEE